jgi:hypothetical protein
MVRMFPAICSSCCRLVVSRFCRSVAIPTADRVRYFYTTSGSSPTKTMAPRSVQSNRVRRTGFSGEGVSGADADIRGNYTGGGASTGAVMTTFVNVTGNFMEADADARERSHELRELIMTILPSVARAVVNVDADARERAQELRE